MMELICSALTRSLLPGPLCRSSSTTKLPHTHIDSPPLSATLPLTYQPRKLQNSSFHPSITPRVDSNIPSLQVVRSDSISPLKELMSGLSMMSPLGSGSQRSKSGGSISMSLIKLRLRARCPASKLHSSSCLQSSVWELLGGRR